MELSHEPRPLEVAHDLMDSKTRRVLILEDDPALRRILWRTFAGWGWTAVAAGSVEEAKIFAAERTPYDLVVTDYHLPDGTGLEFMQWVLNQGGSPPFILMSADARLPMLTKVRRLQKPFSIDELREIVETIVPLCSKSSGSEFINGTAVAESLSTEHSRKTK